MAVSQLPTFIADGALVLLAVGHLTLGARDWIGNSARVLAVTAAVLIAWATSESLKVIIRAPRPCHDIATRDPCPGPTDWSLPSNHATIAGALATCWTIFSPRTAPLAWLLALAVSGARVVDGVHRVADVAAGLAIGVVVVWLASALHRGHARART